jgi:aminoglycoside phosphotransferase family enzyme/predicted kinase
MYLDVVRLTKKNDDLEIDGNGEVVDYAVKMKEFPQRFIMTNLLEKATINQKVLRSICSQLVAFYNSGEHSQKIDRYGAIPSIKKNIDENFLQTKSYVDHIIPQDIYQYIQEVSYLFFNNKNIFRQRVKEGRISDCHGDLHTGNIVIYDKIYIFDCIEFNKRFRYIDVAADIGFLAMDLDFLNYPFLSSYVIHTYIELSGDKHILDVLNFYKCYRAYVRGKITCFALDDPTIDKKNRNTMIGTARKYFDLAYYYAKLFSLDLRRDKRPLLFVVCGLTGTGKSTIAGKISIDYHGKIINTDIVRKDIANINRYEPHHDAYTTGLYTPKKIDMTYKAVMEKAQKTLLTHGICIVDATFQKRKFRDMVRKVARMTKAHLLFIRCICKEKEIKQRLENRLKKKSVSDGRWDIYLQQKESFEPLTSDEDHILIDTSDTSYDNRMTVFTQILNDIISKVRI